MPKVHLLPSSLSLPLCQLLLLPHLISIYFQFPLRLFKVYKEHKFTIFSKYIKDLTTPQHIKTGLIQKGFEKVKFCEHPVSNYIIFSCAYILFVFTLSGYANK